MSNNLDAIENKANYKFEFKEFPYELLQIIPDGRIMNKSYEELVYTIHSLYKDIKKRVTYKNSNLSILKIQPCFFEIYFNGNQEITFNIAVNSEDINFVKHRFESTLPYSDFIIKDDYITEFENCVFYQYDYLKHYMCSMETAHEKSPIKSLLSLKKNLDSNEKLLFQVEIVPAEELGGGIWKERVFDAQKKIKKGIDVVNKTSLLKKAIDGIYNTTQFGLDILDEILEIHPNTVEQENISKTMTRHIWSSLSSSTRQKPNQDGFKCRIRAFIKTEEENNIHTLGKSIEVALKDMSGDNELVMGNKKEVTKQELNRKYNPFKRNNNILSSLELAQFMKFPDGVLQRKFGVRSINFRQITPPK